MITSPFFDVENGQQFANYAIYSTLLDLTNNTLEVHVGSWTGTIDGQPQRVTPLLFHYAAWAPERFDSLPADVMAHPDWIGTGPIKPSAKHIWNPVSLEWDAPIVMPIVELKAAKWAEIKTARNTVEYAGFIWDNSTFDSDPVSQQRISGAVQLATLNPQFTVTWTLKDNTARVLNAEQMKAVGLALGTHVEAQFTRAQTLRTQLDAAQTADEITALNWSTTRTINGTE